MLAERFRAPLVLRCSMRKCLTCGTEIPDTRRKDARYCKKPECRARDFRRRKREAEAASSHLSHSNATQRFTVTCSCGSQILIQVTHLKSRDLPPPTLNQGSTPEAVTQSVTNTTEGRVDSPSASANPAQAGTANGSCAVSPANSVAKSADMDGGTPDQPAAVPVPTRTDTGPAVGMVLPLAVATSHVRWTCELFGVVGRSRVIPLKQALYEGRDGQLELVPGVVLAMGRMPSEGHGLSGSPGVWPERYPETSPVAFGLDADLAIVYWDAHLRRAEAIPVDVVEQLLGKGWRGVIRARLIGGSTK